MITEKRSERYQRRREISFSDLEDNSMTNFRNCTPSPASRDLYSRTNREAASPLHNLHYKYLPENYVSPQKKKQNRDSIKFSSRTPIAKDYANHNTNEIVKINSKIKSILKSLEQEEMRGQIYVKKYSNNQVNLPNRYADRYQMDHPSRFTTPLKQKNMNKALLNNSGKYSNMSSIKAQQKENYSIRRQHNSKLKYSHASSEQQSKAQPTSYNLLNSRYLNYSASRIKRMKCEQTLVNGKNIDHQIDKIQSKVKELDKLKKSLGLDFQASKVTQKGSEAETTLKQSESKDQSKCLQPHQLKNSIQSVQKTQQLQITMNNEKQTNNIKQIEEQQKCSKTNLLVKSQFYNLKQNFNEQDVNVPKLLRNLPSKRKKAGKRFHTQYTNLLQIQSTVSQFFNTNTQTPQSLQTGRQQNTQLKVSDVKAALSNLDKKKQQGNQLKRLLFNLQKQIKADEQLRKIKKWFQRLKNQMKWCDLQKYLRKRGISMNTASMKESFGITSQEQNPFYTPRQQDFKIQDLVNAYRTAHENWASNIQQNYSRQKLKDALFVQQNIDISKRGSITIEDLVRYINYELDTFYRNRDVHLIYHRFTCNSKLCFSKLIQCLAYKQH